MKITFDYYPEGRTKALTMSYDDGQIHDRKLVEIFNKYGIKGTFHLNSGTLDTEPFLGSSEIRGLFQGHEVAAHSLTHPFLTTLPKEVLIEEIVEDRRRLEDLVSYPVRGMSYPFGDYNRELSKELPSFGIAYSRTVESTNNFRFPGDFLTWHPTCHHNENLMEKLKEFQNPEPWEKMPLLYVWGHSFEFARDDNWEVVEQFCEGVSKLQSVWCATNVEIMDYIKALKNLRFSVDKKFVKNTAAVDVWIGVDEKPLKIESGATVQLAK